MKDNLFRTIREGTKKEAREAFQKLLANNMRTVFAAIMARNFSHNIGNEEFLKGEVFTTRLYYLFFTKGVFCFIFNKLCEL